ncbi:hypothetical protein WN943_022770 [Citrus x changshan-huyou]
MKDLPKQIQCASVETTAIGEDLQENASTSFEMPNEISTQQSNMAITFQEGNTVNANLNQYESLGYSNRRETETVLLCREEERQKECFVVNDDGASP